MKKEDFYKDFEEAVGKIRPKDRTHRFKLFRLLKAVRVIGRDFWREIKEIRKETKRLSKLVAVDPKLKKLLAAREAAEMEHFKWITETFDRQADIIERIAESWPKQK